MTALSGVSGTALGVARARASETERADRLFDDPYAAAFVAAGNEMGEKPPPPSTDSRVALYAALGFQIIIRTRFYDDFLLGARAGGIDQVVLLAAGLDTRAYRLDWPAGTRLIEVDLPPVLEFKHQVLAERAAVPRCERVPVAADLLGDWTERVLAAGLDSTRPTAWLAEGLLIYLDADQATGVLRALTDLSAPGSVLSGMDGDGQRLLARIGPPGDPVTAMWKGGLGTGTADWLTGAGWRVETHPLREVAASYGRPASERAISAFLTATYR